MGLKLDKVIPWGRCLDEYIGMFHLTSADRKLAILDCAGGPASFNAEMTRQGNKVTSCDPIYQFSAEEIDGRIQETYQTVIDGVRANADDYLWTNIESPTKLGEVRRLAMQQFLEDLPQGIDESRYITGELPILPFDNRQFDLALCSHFLFTYSDLFSEAFHLESIREMCRTAAEVRIFPLVKVSGEPSPLLAPIITELKAQGYKVEVQEVSYEFQKGGDQLLRVWPVQ
ncbi:MAG: SAM-dependent methyltransferase [Oscillatoriales cyanobacterium]|nr:MAG: SAM-dependent methyltransferase [Oscillatoriales cyanobacterium]TAH23285.1 MAG: SAM-dependent methyltransferase [Oscillatoriales cyanobacterium]